MAEIQSPGIKHWLRFDICINGGGDVVVEVETIDANCYKAALFSDAKILSIITCICFYDSTKNRQTCNAL